MTDGLLSLSWNNHKTTFCHILSTLREKERYSDVTLACEGKFYPTHKLVLSTCSEYFEKMFENTPCKHPVILLGKDVKCDDLEALLSYMYDGVVSVAQNDLARLIKVAELLQIKGLAVPDEPPQTKRNYSWNSRDDRTSPHPKRRRREENFSSAYTGDKNSSPAVSPLRIEPEQTWEQSNTSEGAAEVSPRLELPRKQEVDSVQSQETSEETLVKEEIVETIDENPNEDPGTEYSSNTGGDASAGDLQHLDSNKSQPLHEAVVEALAGPSGMQGWLGTSDMGSGFPILESFSEEGNQDPQPVPVSGTQQPHQMVELQCKGSVSLPAITAGNEGLKSFPVDSPIKVVRSTIDSSSTLKLGTTVEGISTHIASTSISSIPMVSTSNSASTRVAPETITIEDIPTQVASTSILSIPMVSTSSLESSRVAQDTKTDLATSVADSSKDKQTGPAYRCTFCYYATSVWSDLQKHMEKHLPSLEKVYRCDNCSYSTASKGSLNQHMRIHTGEKPFACPYCDYRANQKSHVNQHMVKHLKLWSKKDSK